mmetsp:Transcript_62689/g.198508  ORF Transcript_62689/g.198508 Transcript_62689/m.198508 type:complete len:170 (-) Transcript_62689:190-699(-)
MGRMDIHRVTASSARGARCVALSGPWGAGPGGGAMFTGGADGTVRVFDPRRADDELYRLNLHNSDVNCLHVDPWLKRLVSGGDDSKVVPVSLERARPRRLQPVGTKVGVLCVAFDHSRIVAGCEDSSVRLFDFQVPAETEDVEAWAAAARFLEARRPEVGNLDPAARGM